MVPADLCRRVFWGINSFNDMLAATGGPKGVLADRLKWLQAVDCLHRKAEKTAASACALHLTRKSVEL